MIAPPDPIVAVLGGKSSYPVVYLQPWYRRHGAEVVRSKFSEAVFVYQDPSRTERGADGSIAEDLAGEDLLNQGEATVRIQNVHVYDDGLYLLLQRRLL